MLMSIQRRGFASVVFVFLLIVSMFGASIANASPASSGQLSVASGQTYRGQNQPSIVSNVYTDGLQNGWQNWSWGSSVNLQDTSYVRTGSFSLSCAYTTAWGGLQLGHDGFNTTGYDNLVFYVNGGANSGQSVSVNLVDAGGGSLPSQDLNPYITGGSIQANTWRAVAIPLNDLGGRDVVITGIVLQDALGGAQPRFYVDDMQFATVANATPTGTPTNTRTATATWTGTPPTATRTPTSMPTNTPASGLPPIPAGLPTYYSFGLFSGNTSDLPVGVPVNYRYQYLAGGVNTGDGWAEWNPGGGYATNYINSTRGVGMMPTFIYYQILQSAPSYDEYSNFQNASTMHNYYDDFKLLMQKCGQAGGTIMVDIEPDLTGVMQQHSSNTNNDASRQPVKVQGSGHADVAGYPDNFRGFYQALAHIRDLYAPNTLLGIDISSWGAGADISIVTDPSFDWAGHAGDTATYLNSLGPGYQMLFWNPSDRDAAWYASQGSPHHWWDDTNATYPNFNRMAQWMGAIVTQMQKRVMMWQVPNGNRVYRSENNTNGHWQDNRTEYFLNPTTGRQHISQWANYGFLGMMYGAGVGSQSHYFDSNGDGITNPAPINGNNQTAIYADDDGGYMRLNLAAYYSGGTVPLPGGGGGGTPVPTNTPTTVRTNTPVPPTSTRTNTRTPAPPTSTHTPMPTDTPTETDTPIPPTETRTSTATRTATLTRTATNTPLPTQTPGGPTATPTEVPSDTPTDTPTETDTPTYTSTTIPPTYTRTPAPATSTRTRTSTPQATDTPTEPSPTACAISFTDVNVGDYFYAAVQYLFCEGAVSGYSDGTFRPYNNTTRGQLCKIVVVAEGWPIDTSGGPHFSDVAPSNAFYQYVETALNRDIIAGYSDGTFRPYNNVTRGQLCKVIVRAQGWPIFTDGGPHFSDVPTNHPFYEYIETAFSHSIVGGYSDGTFRPGNNATRGQICKIVYNAVVGP